MILDYLFFYLTYWFNKNSDKLKWSSPVERSSYVIGIATTTFLVSIAEVLSFTLYKDSNSTIPKFVFVGVGLGIMYLYDYIYIKKDRYSAITSKNSFDSKSYKWSNYILDNDCNLRISPIYNFYVLCSIW